MEDIAELIELNIRELCVVGVYRHKDEVYFTDEDGQQWVIRPERVEL